MRIETEFCPEDEVYVLHNEEIVRAKILKIEIIATFEENIIRYNIKLEDRKHLCGYINLGYILVLIFY